jgi:opacity protein-like surface antigen
MKLNLNNLTLLSALFITGQASAGTMGPAPVNYNGFYVGGTVGLGDLNVKEFANANGATKPETHHLGGFGFVGGGLVGYDYSITDRIKFGVEGFFNGNTMNAKAIHNFNRSIYRVKQRYNTGVRILPGYEFVPGANGHIILGYSNARYKLTDDGAYGFVCDRFNRSGFQAGLGMTANFISNLSVRLDALYTTYGRRHSLGVEYNATNGPAGSGTGIGLANGIPNLYRNTFETLEGNLTVIYKFA